MSLMDKYGGGNILIYGLPLGISPPWAPGEPGGEQADYDYVNIHRGSHPTGPNMWNDWPDAGIATVVYGVAEVVPEPATLSLLALGAAAILRRRRR